MSDLIYTISVPFKRKGKEALKESEFVLSLSIDLNWFNPQQAKAVLKEAERAGHIKRERDMVCPTFDLDSIQIPQGFRPDAGILEKKTLFDRIIDRITSGTGMDKHKVIALINKKQDELSKLVEIEVSALLVALEQGIGVDDLIEEEYEALVNSRSSS
jgi:hypothetical protein